MGYLPEAMVNFLALLGWSPGTDQEIFTRDELVAAFSLDGISGGNAVFNPEKLDWFNQQHIARLSAEEIATRIEPQLREAGLWRDTFATSDREWLLRVIELLKPRIKKLGQIVEDGALFLAGAVQYHDGAVTKHLGVPGTRGHLEALHATLASAQPFDQATIESVLRGLATERGIKAASLIHATRVAVTGKTVSPGLFEVVELVGRDRTLSRLEAAMELASS